jgi:hypothetical protein
LILAVAGLPALTDWTNFYVIVGSSAGALTGLQFVVIALIAEREAASSTREIRAFGTPTVVHFCAALLVSAVMSAPWPGLANVAIGLASCGAAGVVYALTVIRHARKTAYRPDFEDWVWFAILPLHAYLALVVAAVLLPRHPQVCMFAIAATTLVLLFVGIHNAWDTVTYIAIQRRRGSQEDGK